VGTTPLASTGHITPPPPIRVTDNPLPAGDLLAPPSLGALARDTLPTITIANMQVERFGDKLCGLVYCVQSVALSGAEASVRNAEIAVEFNGFELGDVSVSAGPISFVDKTLGALGLDGQLSKGQLPNGKALYPVEFSVGATSAVHPEDASYIQAVVASVKRNVSAVDFSYGVGLGKEYTPSWPLIEAGITILGFAALMKRVLAGSAARPGGALLPPGIGGLTPA
jgi:hypothetical protein